MIGKMIGKICSMRARQACEHSRHVTRRWAEAFLGRWVRMEEIAIRCEDCGAALMGLDLCTGALLDEVHRMLEVSGDT